MILGVYIYENICGGSVFNTYLIRLRLYFVVLFG